MRSQTTKPTPKKGAQSKTTLKSNPPSKQVKKKTDTPKNVQNLLKKSLSKTCKKNVIKEDSVETKKDTDSTPCDKSETVIDQGGKTAVSKPQAARSPSPGKKTKYEGKEKKDPPKNSSDSIQIKNNKKSAKAKSDKRTKTIKVVTKITEEDGDDVKYKLNSEIIKSVNPKFSKAKTIIKRMPCLTQNKKSPSPIKLDKIEREGIGIETKSPTIFNKIEENLKLSVKLDSKDPAIENVSKMEESNKETNSGTKINNMVSPVSNSSIIIPIETPPKTENERPPKFFTSNRSPRTVDIDVKCFKTTKGNLSMSERFLPMKCVETKTDDSGKDKINLSNNLISQGAEVDVYTFTDKVDSPKSILSGFRSPLNKNVGRVRPIARVKGTVIDKTKSDNEKKKYSPHRPIEEVVKQLKANKKTEEMKFNQFSGNEPTSSGGVDTNLISDTKEDDEKPRAIISKSYKMVARKTSIPGQPYNPIKLLDDDLETENKPMKKVKSSTLVKKSGSMNLKKKTQKISVSDEDLDACKFSFNTKSKNMHYSSSEESISESNDDNDTKESSESDTPKSKKLKNKRYKRITDSMKKNTSKELQELSKDSLVDLKEDSVLLGKEKPSKRRLKLFSMWTGPKKHRMASLNALAKVHCLYENESRTHMELGLMKTVDKQVTSNTPGKLRRKEKNKTDSNKRDSTSESEYERKEKSHLESSEEDSPTPNTRTLRVVPGIRSAGKYWDPKSSTSSSEDSELDYKKKINVTEKKKSTFKAIPIKSDSDKPPAKMKKTSGANVKKKRNRNEVVMDLKDMVVQKRMASLNATAILAASYEKRSPKSSKDDSTSDSCSDESFTQKPKNGVGSGVKSETKNEDATEQESDEIVTEERKQKVEVIVNQDTDVTITGVYSTHHHEGFCTVSGMQYRISSTSHTQTTATANCDKEGCSRDETGARYTPLSALSSMQPPADQAHTHSHPVAELGGLTRRAAGCSSAFSAPSPSAHHDPGKTLRYGIWKAPPPVSPYGYYQPAGPLIKEGASDAERALARYHAPHYHPPHPPVLQQYAGPYYPADLCYGRYYRPPGPYHVPPPPQTDAQMVGVGSEPYPPPQYYGAPPCYQHPPQRVPYIEYRCPCPMNAFPKNVHIGPATGKAPTGGGPDAASAPVAPPGGAFRPKVRAARVLDHADTHGSGKDPPREPEPPAAADAPRPCLLPAALGGASPKRELYDVRDNLRLAGDTPGPAEAVGPPSPARGSAGACAPQPPPVAPRRARLGKAMARRSLAGDDTGLLLSAPQPPPASSVEADDDVLAISPPASVPIDLSSSDETDRRSIPLVDVKKENEGPTQLSPRKSDALALREHNSTAVGSTPESTDGPKPVKRRYSKPKLEIELCDMELNDSCRTNGIGEHVKLQKRRKVAADQSETVSRLETSLDTKKKVPTKQKSVIKNAQSATKKNLKRKSDSVLEVHLTKRSKADGTMRQDEDRVNKIFALEDGKKEKISRPKNKSALLLDNLIRKNSIDRPDTKSFDLDAPLNPAELFFNENETPGCGKKSLNINNNIVDESIPINDIHLNAIAAVTQHINKKIASGKMAYKTEKGDKEEMEESVYSLHPTKAVLNSPLKKLCFKEENLLPTKLDDNITKNTVKNLLKLYSKIPKSEKGVKKLKSMSSENEIKEKSQSTISEHKNCVLNSPLISITTDIVPEKLCANVINSKLGFNKTDTKEVTELSPSEKNDTPVPCNNIKPMDLKIGEKDTIEKILPKTTSKLKSVIDNLKSQKPKLNNSKNKSDNSMGEVKEKVVKLLVSKKPAIKSDEAAAVIEEACASPVARCAGRRSRRKRSVSRRLRRPAPPLTLPVARELRAPPRWSNGWTWDGEPYVSKVYLNNDARLDRPARCWSRMTHTSGDCVARGDCVLLRASSARAQPFVARVARLWENPEDGEMMVSLVWYYRPEHTERGRQPEDAPDEVFASRHRDANSVACIEDKCYVLTFNEYCRYRKRLKAAEEGIAIPPSVVPPMPAAEVTPAVAINDTKLPPSVSPELVLFCRKIYDFRSKKIVVPNK